MEGGVNTCEGCPVDAEFLAAYNVLESEGADQSRLERINRLRGAFDERVRLTKETPGGACPEKKPMVTDGNVVCPLRMAMNTLSLLIESPVPVPRNGSSPQAPMSPSENGNGDRYTALERQGYH